MNKRTGIIGVVVVLVIFAVLFGYKAMKKEYITKVTPTEIQTKVDNKESFFFVIGAASCSACIAYQPTLEEYNKTTDQPVYYVDIEKLNASERESFLTTYPIEGTPTNFFVKDGQVKQVVVGGIGLSEIKNNVDKYTK